MKKNDLPLFYCKKMLGDNPTLEIHPSKEPEYFQSHNSSFLEELQENIKNIIEIDLKNDLGISESEEIDHNNMEKFQSLIKRIVHTTCYQHSRNAILKIIKSPANHFSQHSIEDSDVIKATKTIEELKKRKSKTKEVSNEIIIDDDDDIDENIVEEQEQENLNIIKRKRTLSKKMLEVEENEQSHQNKEK